MTYELDLFLLALTLMLLWMLLGFICLWWRAKD